jgi:hypothetical protein
MTGLIGLHGGKDKLAAKLDELFSAPTKTSGREQSDISGLIGQYAHGNEPSHHISYLYPFVGQAWKTQELVHRIIENFYMDKPDGLIGNEDCGQMSAWAVMSAMGFYSVNPGSNFYVIGTPWFPKVTLHLENGKSFIINASNLSKENFYIQSAKLNGKTYKASFLLHQAIMKGGEISFEMGSQPNKDWGTGKKNEPATAIADNLIVPAPYTVDNEKTFTQSKDVRLSGPEGAKIFFSDGKGTKEYTQAVHFTETGKLRFYAEYKGTASPWITSEFLKIKDDKDATLKNPPAHQYSGNGAVTLIDGLRGTSDYRVGGWLGFEKVDLEAVLDLRSLKKVKSLGAGFLQDQNSWIFMPSQVEFLVSTDGINYTPVGTVKNDIPTDKPGTILKDFSLTINETEARYVKVIGKSLGTCPEGHKGFPNPCWIFCDELIAE